jgi:hypothetical protein
LRKEVKNKRKQAPTSTSMFLHQLIDENGNAHSIHGLSQHKIRYHDSTQNLRISESPKSFPVMPFTFQDGFFNHHTKPLYRVPSSRKHNDKNHMRRQVVASHLTVPVTNPSKFHNTLDVNSCLMLFTQEFISRQASMRNKTTKALQA